MQSDSDQQLPFDLALEYKVYRSYNIRMSSPGQQLSRRKLLAAGAAGATGLIAGCPACATSVRSYDDRLRVSVPRITVGETHAYTLQVHHRGSADFDPEVRDSFGTAYEDVSVVAYGHDQSSIGRGDLGEFEPGTTKTLNLESDAFPFLVTASASGFRDIAGDGCYYADRGAMVAVYLGRFDSPVTVGREPRTLERAGDGDGGHQWMPLSERRHGDELPPRGWVFARTKCLQQAGRQVSSLPTPDLTALDATDPWWERPIGEPTVDRRYRIGVSPTSNYREGHADQFRTDHSTLVYEDLPDRIKRAIRGRRDVGVVDEAEFYDLVSELEDREIAGHEDLPGCDRRYVVCNDDRGVHCEAGTARWNGRLGQYLWYHTSYEGESFVVVPGHVENWQPASASRPPPCGDSRQETFSVDIYRQENRYAGLDTAKRGEAVPEALETWVARNPESYHGMEFSETEWKDAIRTLEGRADIDMPECRWSHVQCTRDSSERCGGGVREAFYRLSIDGESWWFRFIYQWTTT